MVMIPGDLKTSDMQSINFNSSAHLDTCKPARISHAPIGGTVWLHFN